MVYKVPIFDPTDSAERLSGIRNESWKDDQPVKEPSMKTLLTTSELMDYLDVSRPTIYRFIKDNCLPHIRLGRTIRYDKAAVDEWIAQQTLRADVEAAVLRKEHPKLGGRDLRRPVTLTLD